MPWRTCWSAAGRLDPPADLRAKRLAPGIGRNRMRTLIVGGGVAGLGAAISLQRAGLEVEVMEISPDWAPRGAALTLQSNALAMLGRLGLLETVLDAGVVVPDD